MSEGGNLAIPILTGGLLFFFLTLHQYFPDDFKSGRASLLVATDVAARLVSPIAKLEF